MRCVIKRRRESAVNHRSIPAQSGTHLTFSVLSRERRNPSVVGLPHYAFVAFAFRLRSLSPSASLGATPTPTAHTRSAAPTASCSGLLWLANSEVPGACCRTPSAPNLCGSLYGSAISPRHTPTSAEYEKREALPPPFGVSNCYSSNPCTTVSSVEDSNARAASVTGK